MKVVGEGLWIASGDKGKIRPGVSWENLSGCTLVVKKVKSNSITVLGPYCAKSKIVFAQVNSNTISVGTSYIFERNPRLEKIMFHDLKQHLRDMIS